MIWVEGTLNAILCFCPGLSWNRVDIPQSVYYDAMLWPHDVLQYSRGSFGQREENNPNPSESQFCHKVKVKRDAHQTQFLGMKCQDIQSQIAIGVMNKMTAFSTLTRKSNTSSLRCFGFLHILDYSLTVNPLYDVIWKKTHFTWGRSSNSLWTN